MISKKMRNISMVCLSLVLALTLAFGLSSFSVKTADAAEYTNNVANATSAVESGETVTYTYPMLNSGKLKGNTFAFEVPSNTASATLKFVDNGSSTNRWCYIYPKGVSTIERDAAEEAVANSDTPGRWSLYSGSGKTHVFGFTKDDLLVTGEKSYLVIGTADDYKFKDTFTVVATLEASKTINSISPLTGTYELMVGQDISVANLPSEVTGNWTDSNSASGTITVPVTKWTADTSAVGTVVATGTLGAVQGYTLGIETVTANLTVKEIEKIEITSFDAIDSISKVYGTAQGDLGLPATVTANDGSVFGVTWTIEPEYTGAVGNYTATGTVEYDETYYTVTAANPTVAIEITAIPVANQVLEGTYYTFDNANVLGLPATIAVSGVDFEISWGEYADGVVTGSLVAKAGYDVSNATVTANVELVSSAKSINFGAMGTSADEQVAVDQFSGEGYTLNSNTATTLDAGSADQTQYRGLKIKNSDVVLTFFVKGEANVSFAIGSGSFTFTYTDVNGKNQTATADGGTPGQAYSYLVKDSKCTLQRNGSSTSVIKYINIDDGNSTTYSAFGKNNQLPATAAAKEGYEFIGWQYNNNLVAPNAVVEPTTPTGNTDCYGDIYTAVYAKAKYLGISFRKSAESPAVRFGYVVNIVDANENALNGLTLNASAVFNVANLTKDSSSNVNFGALNIAYNENKGGYLANLAITGIDSAKAQNALNVDMTITINGVSITAESDVTTEDTIVKKAQTLYDAGQLTDKQAEIYGVKLNG